MKYPFSSPAAGRFFGSLFCNKRERRETNHSSALDECAEEKKGKNISD